MLTTPANAHIRFDYRIESLNYEEIKIQYEKIIQ